MKNHQFVRHLPKRPSLTTDKPSQQLQQSNAIPSGFRVLGLAKTCRSQESSVVFEANTSKGHFVYLVSVSELVTGDRKFLLSCLVECGHFNQLDRKSVNAIAVAMLQEAQTQDTSVLVGTGIKEVDIQGSLYRAYIWGKKSYWLGDKPPDSSVVLLEEHEPETAGSFDDWKQHIGARLPGNYILIGVIAHALAAILCEVFQKPRLSLILVGPSGIGKTITQRCGQSMIGPCQDVLTMSGTAVGIREYLLSKPDAPVFFQDTRQYSPDDLIALIFDVADGAPRLKSGPSNARITSTLILSNERRLADMRHTGKLALDEGIYARCLEIDCDAEYGAFHCIHGAKTSADFAKQLEKYTAQFFGKVWPKWAGGVSRNWGHIQAHYEATYPKIKQRLIDIAGDASMLRVNNRILDSLAFSAWVGVVSVRCSVLPLKGDEVIEAFAQILQQYISRQKIGLTPLSGLIIAKIQGFFDEHISKFLDLSLFDQGKEVSAMYGYKYTSKSDGDLLLIFPHVFQRLVIDQFGGAAYQILKGSGLLVSSKGRGYQYQVRVPRSEERKSFIAIKDTIRFC